jgi:acyl dehydratase
MTTPTHTETIAVGGPWFEDFVKDKTLPVPPAVTLTDGHAALHQAVFGDRLRLPLDHTLSREVTGAGALIHPMLAINLAIGMSTYATQRVKANLFYRGLVLKRPVFVGDTLTTTTRAVALRQNRPKPGRAATGLVVLEIATVNQRGETVLHFWRCPMIACRDPNADTGHNDDLDVIPSAIADAELDAAVPAWALDRFRARVPGSHFASLRADAAYRVEGRDSITSAPEMARATLNLAATHYDAGASAYGERLIFGGHTIALAAAAAVRALPEMMTLLAWRSCDHLAPVFEGDMIETRIEVAGLRPLASGGGLADLRAVAQGRARREERRARLALRRSFRLSNPQGYPWPACFQGSASSKAPHSLQRLSAA